MIWPFNRLRKSTRGCHPWDLSYPLLQVSKHDRFTVGDSCQGCHVWGSTGSGKTTGSMATLIRAMLATGFGGIFFTAKPSDAATYEKYCAETGRSPDVIKFGPEHDLTYNFLHDELHRSDGRGQHIENIAGLLFAVLEACKSSSSGEGREEGSYWQRATEQLVRNALELLVLAYDRISIAEIYRLVNSAPQSLEQVRSKSWQQSSHCLQALAAASKKGKSPRQAADYALIADYFLQEFPALSSRSRSVIISTLTSMLDVLQRGVVRDLISTPKSTMSPEWVKDGAVIIVEADIKTYSEVGRLLQVAIKYCFQRIRERCDVVANPRPVFMVADEAHLLTVSSDQVFQTTARSSKTATLDLASSLASPTESVSTLATKSSNETKGDSHVRNHARSRVDIYAAKRTGDFRRRGPVGR